MMHENARLQPYRANASGEQQNRLRPQRGFIAMLLLVMVAVVAVLGMTKNLWGTDDATLTAQKETQVALQQAKQAVLAYVKKGNDATNTNFLYATNDGRLPCPDTNGNGTAEIDCGSASDKSGGISSLGLLPWSTLGLPPLRDAANECLWYAVDGRFKISAHTNNVLNVPYFGLFSVIQPLLSNSWSEQILAGGTNAASGPNRVVAVIFAPGSARNTQQRPTLNGSTCPISNNASQYLESYGGVLLSGSNNTIPTRKDTQTTFVQADVNQLQLNDQLVWITADEFAAAATKRAAYEARYFLTKFKTAKGHYPAPAQTVGGACSAGLNTGFLPLGTCEGIELFPQVTLTGNQTPSAARLADSTPSDNWLMQMHYAVNATVANMPAPAIVLMRGRQRPGQTCISTLGADMFNCIEDSSNQAIVKLAPSSNNATLNYQIPSAVSNDFLLKLQ